MAVEIGEYNDFAPLAPGGEACGKPENNVLDGLRQRLIGSPDACLSMACGHFSQISGKFAELGPAKSAGPLVAPCVLRDRA